ncbi:MAG TPA: dihydrodipicolinate reductase C-terminal domain-containing protein [Vicinamibacterales bacterium]|nr:dihydrodipicolinate reductase C-terminal domain-containing protein [Vicinamibacterales bacterium]
MRLLLVGHGRMGQLVEKLAPEHGCEVAAVAEIHTPIEQVLAGAGHVDVAIDFSQPDAVRGNLDALAERRLNVVIGTTGWHAHETEMRARAAEAGIGVLAAANFSLGMNVFSYLVEQAARAFMNIEDVGAWIHEAHHTAKKDAPSGTALMLLAAMQQAGYTRAIDMSSTRAGAIPGTHVVGFDGGGETVTLTHSVRDRSVFAHGALEAARWLNGRRGWFNMRDLINSP